MMIASLETPYYKRFKKESFNPEAYIIGRVLVRDWDYTEVNLFSYEDDFCVISSLGDFWIIWRIWD